MKSAGRPLLAGGILWVLLVTPPARAALESTMTLQMLAQIPLLGVTGWQLARAMPVRWQNAIDRWNHQGITGLVLVSLMGLIWALPKAMDAALDDSFVMLAKFLSVPLLIGLPLALSWPKMGFVVRGVFLSEIVASCFRMGWLYLISPIRLCNNYLLDDQQRLGKYLVAIGVAIMLILAWKLMWGRINIDHTSRNAPSPDSTGRHR